ncbi:MAG: hypothetical protein ACRDIY_11730 [Chloroflexota bacterium]
MKPENAGGTLRGAKPAAAQPEVEVDDEQYEEEQRVAITVGVADGFKFGCGMILAGIAFYFALIILVAAALLLALVFNLPLPFGLTGR